MMPQSRKAWSCWNYLSFTVMVPDAQPAGHGDMSDTTTEAGLYSEREDAAPKPRPLVKMQVNEVSLCVFCHSNWMLSLIEMLFQGLMA